MNLAPAFLGIVGVVIGAVITKTFDYLTTTLKIQDEGLTVARTSVAEVLTQLRVVQSGFEFIATDLDDEYRNASRSKSEVAARFDESLREIESKAIEFDRSCNIALLTTPIKLHPAIHDVDSSLRAWGNTVARRASNAVQAYDPSESRVGSATFDIMNAERRALATASQTLLDESIASLALR